jgi:hypothetical protein
VRQQQCWRRNQYYNFPICKLLSSGHKILKILWWFCRGCSPLPIPNREVKPLMADGTALSCGRVGSCHIYWKSSGEIPGTFFYLFPILRSFQRPLESEKRSAVKFCTNQIRYYLCHPLLKKRLVLCVRCAKSALNITFQIIYNSVRIRKLNLKKSWEKFGRRKKSTTFALPSKTTQFNSQKVL